MTWGGKFEVPLEASPEHIMLMGRIAANWAYMDSILAIAFGYLIGNHSAAEAIYYSSSSQSLRLDMMRASTRVSNLPDELKDRCTKLLDQIGDLWKRRNTLMHNTAEVDKNDPSAFATWVRRPLRNPPDQRLPLLASEMEEHIAALNSAAWQLLIFSSPEVARTLLASIEKLELPGGNVSEAESHPDQPQVPSREPDVPPQSSEE